MYNCQSYAPRAKADTTRRDSINVEEEIVLDEDGTPVERKISDPSDNEQETAPKKEGKHPKEQVVNFDDL